MIEVYHIGIYADTTMEFHYFDLEEAKDHYNRFLAMYSRKLGEPIYCDIKRDDYWYTEYAIPEKKDSVILCMW